MLFLYVRQTDQERKKQMFDTLSGRLGEVFARLKKRAVLSEADVSAALREVRIALLEADVALPVVKDFIFRVKQRAIGVEVLRAVSPGQQIIKIVHDELITMLGGEETSGFDLRAAPPAIVLMVGLQGSGKTTSTAKTAKMLASKRRVRILMASLDTRRPAAMEQLAQLGRQIGIATLAITPGQNAVAIARRAMNTARREGFDVVFLDTAGRQAIDEELMAEVIAVRDAVHPVETLLVADALTGQDAVNTAKIFNERAGLTGIVLTRIDGDSRGGAALSVRAATGCPIRLLGVGEKIDALEPFDARRIAGRILGMGDVVGLVERATEVVDRSETEAMAQKAAKGRFDLDDMATQLRNMRKIGGINEIVGMLPGMGNIGAALNGAGVDESVFLRQESIILSMTRVERRRPEIIKASRKRRIANGSGTSVQEVNRLLKQFAQMQTMMKRMNRLGDAGLKRHGIGALLGSG